MATEQENIKLEKALDKACDLTMNILDCINNENCKHCPLDHCVKKDISNKWERGKDIKKDLLKESEKQ